ncbi:MAG: methylenetetrahydrofolate--tRNA-(uracil(54)-C(5))-methyltransferase (FADH(2)-oxidizing) TrmFO [Acidobacteriia bacterium]|nr:methylenetetrahydrofolate--tRNA-(uracil(54)-C(5))-methyltransferase (FADH(2)-oxidizing) TrmFO [Terriglobia bacterium]
MKRIVVIGGGLAGSEAAWQVAKGLDTAAAAAEMKVELWEMRPQQSTPAHKTDRLGELVCSNSLKSDSEFSAPWLLKEELRRMNSLLLDVAQETRVPGGHALAVDRERFATRITERIHSHPRIVLRREELREIPHDESTIVVVATGPLTSPALSEDIRRITGEDHLYFFDAISPIVEAESIDRSVAFKASRYGKGGDDYLNCPMTGEEYGSFYEALVGAQCVPTHAFEKEILVGVASEKLGGEKSLINESELMASCSSPDEVETPSHTPYFEGCLPIEELARRGRETLRFGPMKPVGLIDPRTGRMPWACVQLRQETLMADSYNLVGFQNHLRFPEQERVFRIIPGLHNAEFVRFGQMHRNTYINTPKVLAESLQLRSHAEILFAGQLVGVEGYVESIMTGLLAGMNATRLIFGRNPTAPPKETASGALLHYVTHAPPHNFQPMNMVFSLLPKSEERGAHGKKIPKLERHRSQCGRALRAFDLWQKQLTH